MVFEVEVRSFISEQEYTRLLNYFSENARLVKKDKQETIYFLGKDLRIQKNKFFSKIWFKEGKIHDKARKEIEIRFDKQDFEKLLELFLSLGYEIEVKWKRKRVMFEWDDVNVCLDHTKGFGYIIELEKQSKDRSEYIKLEKKLKSLGISITPRDVFEEKYKWYKQNWELLI